MSRKKSNVPVHNRWFTYINTSKQANKQASKQARRFSFLTGATTLVFVRIAVHSFTSLVAPLSLRQFSFLTGSHKLVFVCIEQKVLLLV